MMPNQSSPAPVDPQKSRPQAVPGAARVSRTARSQFTAHRIFLALFLASIAVNIILFALGGSL